MFDWLRHDMREIKEQIAALRVEKRVVSQELTLTEEVVRLKKDIVELEIKKSQKDEAHAKEDRELRHMIGLEKKRQEFEIEQSKRETTVTVREENLAADKKRFEDQMKFHDERFTAEVGYLKGLLGEVLERLPTVTVDRKVK